jgi:hypothetical protein
VKPARRDVGIIAGVLLDVHARAPIVHHDGAASHEPKIRAPRISGGDSAQKTGFGERR